MKRKVVIVGFGYTSRLCLIRSVANVCSEITVVVIEGTKLKPIDCYSKYVKNILYYKSGSGGEGLVNLLLEKCTDKNGKVILIPNNDFTASIIDKNLERLKDFFVFPNINNKQGAIVEWMNKEKQKSLAFELGMNVAKSTNVNIIERAYCLPPDINYPCFTKTRTYTTGYKATLNRCNNEKELRIVLDALCKSHRNITIMVEDYKEIEKEYAVVGFSDGKNVIIPGVLEILAMAKGNDKGVACQGRAVPIKGYESLVSKFITFISTIGFTGLFDIDFYYSDGKYYFGELNLRIGGSGSAIMKMGVNLPAMYILSVDGVSIDNMNKQITKSATYVNERICAENWRDGFLSTNSFRELLKASDISFLKDKKDCKPEYIFKRNLILLFLKKMIITWKKRRG